MFFFSCNFFKRLRHRHFPAMYETRNTGTGNGMRGMGGMLYSGECRQTFRGMLQNIAENVAKYSGECRQTFRGILSKIPWNVTKHFRECSQFLVERAGLHLESCQTSTMELFCENSQRPYYVDYFRYKAPRQTFDWIP